MHTIAVPTFALCARISGDYVEATHLEMAAAHVVACEQLHGSRQR